MTTKFERMERVVDACRCQVCHGLGYVDDLEPGDIFGNKRQCGGCEGTGVNPAFLTNFDKALEIVETFPWQRKEGM